MNEINPVTHAQKSTKIKGKTEMPTLEEKVTELVTKLKNRDREVPEYGDFRVVSEVIENPDSKLPATNFVLQISKPSKNVAGHEKLRDLKAAAYNHPTPYKAEILLATGEKSDILKALTDKELQESLPKIFKKLAYDLEDQT